MINMGKVIGWCIAGAVAVIIVVLISSVVDVSNREVDLRTQITAIQTDNTSEFDNMTKKIGQVAQVSKKQLESLKDIFNSYAAARSGNGDGGQLMKWVQESVPNVDTTTMNNLQNIIVSSRDSWTMRQKQLIDVNREHQKLLKRFPSGVILSMLGRKSIEIKIVTSSRTENAFATGKDDDTNVF